MNRIRAFILFECATFAVAALVHSGALGESYAHVEARIAETLIAFVLFAGYLVSRIRPAWTPIAGIAVQGFALVGTLVGIFTIIVGVGPRTMPDIIYHVAILAVLAWGLTIAVRTRATNTADTHDAARPPA